MYSIDLPTARLILRSFREEDLPIFSAYRTDPQVACYQSWETPYTLDQARGFFAGLDVARPGAPGEWFQLAIERRLDGCMVGDCAFQVNADDVSQAQIGYTLAQQYQGNGYASEAVTALLDFLFGTLGLRRVCAICDAENRASYRLLERLGMRREGHFIENIWFKGAWGSEYQYAILAREWHGRRAG